MKKIIVFHRQIHFIAQCITLFVFTAVLSKTISFAQERKLNYDVIRNGSVIGNIIFTELNSGQKKFLSFVSSIKTSFIFSFCDQTTETSLFENEILVHASLNQKQTGSGRTSTTVETSGNAYKVIDGNTSKIIYINPIYYNTLLLYLKPPENINKVYSQKFQKLLEIKKVAENKFMLILPDGTHNYYTYNSGLCDRVDIERSFFTVHFVLRKS
jgi:hypothetical protein